VESGGVKRAGCLAAVSSPPLSHPLSSQECQSEWDESGALHFDLWVGPTTIDANSPAIFVSTPVDQSTPANSPISYTLPETSDAESNTVTIGLTAGGPTFVSLTQPNILQISPGLLDVGTYSV